jgi:predicted nucleotidyltransferase
MEAIFEAARAAILADLTAFAEAEPRIHALWLQGSLAAGGADAFSDIDAYVAAPDNQFDSLWNERAAVLERLGGALAWSDAAVPGLKAIHALMSNGARLDLFFEKLESVGEAARPAVKLILDKDGLASSLRTDWQAPAGQVARTLQTIIRMTRQGAVWPLRVLGRGQWSTLAVMELELINRQIVQLMAVRHDPGNFYKNPNSQLLVLTNEERARVDALTHDALAALAAGDPAVLKPVHLRVQRALMAEGRAACAALGCDYPIGAAEEEAVLELVERAWPGA